MVRKPARWIVSREGLPVLEAERAEVLEFLRAQDPFVNELADGMRINGFIVCRLFDPDSGLTDREIAIDSFIRSIHTEIHQACEKSSNLHTDDALLIMQHIRDRVDHFVDRYCDSTISENY